MRYFALITLLLLGGCAERKRPAANLVVPPSCIGKAHYLDSTRCAVKTATRMICNGVEVDYSCVQVKH